MQQGNNPREFSVWGAMFTAPFFSGNLFRDVANWRSIGLRLILLVLLITWILEGISWHRGFNAFARNEFPKVIEDFPQITIKDGVVSSPVDQPYYMRDKQTQKTFMILDTTGTITSLDDDPDAVILVTENKLHYRDHNQPGQVKIQDLSTIKNFYVDRPILTNWMNMGAKWAMWVIVPVFFVFSFLFRLVQGLIYGAIGLIWNSAFNAQLPYAALVRLAFVAVTPVLLLDTVLSLAKINLPFSPLIGIAIAMVYLAMAVKANQKEPASPMYGGYGVPPYAPPQQPMQYPYPYQQPPMPPPPPPSA